MGDEDVELMLRVKEGDIPALESLVLKYRQRTVGFLYRVVNDEVVAEELAQEVFLRIYRFRQGYAGTEMFPTWMYRIAVNVALGHDRKKRTNPHERNVSHQGDERVASIRRCVAALPERQRMAVILHRYQGMDSRQIAAVLEISESDAKSLLFYAYEGLRIALRGLLNS